VGVHLETHDDYIESCRIIVVSFVVGAGAGAGAGAAIEVES
jgi:hypothetical protein